MIVKMELMSSIVKMFPVQKQLFVHVQKIYFQCNAIHKSIFSGIFLVI